MRYSQYFIPTVKETPSDAEVISHQLMLRAGMIRKLAAGIYNYLPLGLRSIRKVENIVREEMNRAGAIEILMPTVQPAELWQESGRWEQYGKELLRFKDRKDAEFCLGPTHEEVVTDLVRREVKSYRQLPLNLYQIQGKFRDEIRPRFGLMRGREFIMKDAYSFDVDENAADLSYDKMYQAYRRIFERCGLKFRAVEADTGSIGGSSSHEFMVLADSGEDAIVSCTACDMPPTWKRRKPGRLRLPEHADPRPLEKVATPDKRSIEEVSAFLGVSAASMVKTLVLLADDEPVVALLRGDHELNEIKLKNLLGCDELEMAGDDVVVKVTGAPAGFAGPVGLKVRMVADLAVKGMRNFVTGGNEKDLHLKNVNLERDFTVANFADIRNVVHGDPCPRCEDGQSGDVARHRGRACLQARHQVFQGAEGHLSGRRRQGADHLHGLLRHRHRPHRCRLHRAEPRRERHHLPAPHRAVPLHHLRPQLSKEDAVREASEAIYQQLARGRGRGPAGRPGRAARLQVQGCRPDRHPAADRGGQQEPGRGKGGAERAERAAK